MACWCAIKAICDKLTGFFGVGFAVVDVVLGCKNTIDSPVVGFAMTGVGVAAWVETGLMLGTDVFLVGGIFCVTGVVFLDVLVLDKSMCKSPS